MKNREKLPRWISYFPLIFLAGVLFLSFYKKALANPLSSAAYDDPVAQIDGDTIIVNEIACSSSTVTLLTSTNDVSGVAWSRSSDSNSSRVRPRQRKRAFVNTSAFFVFIGTQSATGLVRGSGTAGGFALGPSTTTASVYVTHNTADFYCQQQNGPTSGAIVTVLEEYNSIP